MAIPEAWIAHVQELLKGEIFTPAAPGKWAGKEGSHTPVVSNHEDGSVTVKVPHVMEKAEIDEDDHWIDYVFVVNQENVIVACSKFTATDDAAELTAVLPGGYTYTPYGHCNKHGLWQGTNF